MNSELCCHVGSKFSRGSAVRLKQEELVLSYQPEQSAPSAEKLPVAECGRFQVIRRHILAQLDGIYLKVFEVLLRSLTLGLGLWFWVWVHSGSLTLGLCLWVWVSGSLVLGPLWLLF